MREQVEGVLVVDAHLGGFARLATGLHLEGQVAQLVEQEAVPGQLVTLWLDDPLVPPLGVTLANYAGIIQSIPYLFIVELFPEAAGPLPLAFPPVPAIISGFPLQLQALVTGEGGVKGSFTNASDFIIP